MLSHFSASGKNFYTYGELEFFAWYKVIFARTISYTEPIAERKTCANFINLHKILIFLISYSDSQLYEKPRPQICRERVNGIFIFI